MPNTENYIDSYYSFSMRDRDGFATLDGDLDVDVAIIGGGFTGVATAYELASKGVRVALCERRKIGSGASGRNGGQVTGSLSGEAAMQREFARTLGAEAANYIWKMRWRGREIIRERIAKEHIECDFRDGHVEAAITRRHMSELRALMAEAEAHGNPDNIALLDRDATRDIVTSPRYIGAVLNPRNFHLHPLDLCIGEARAAQKHGAQIFENTAVLRVEQHDRPRLITAKGTITANRLLIAGNYLTPLSVRKTRGILAPASLGIVATEPLQSSTIDAILPSNVAVYDRRFVLDYYRLSADGRLIFGGGTNYSGLATVDLRQNLRPSIERTFPQLEGVAIDFAWSGHDGIVLNRIPHIGRISDTVFYARGYSGHGIAISHLAGEIIANAMTGDTSDLEVFEAVRHFRLPESRGIGNAMMALGMAYYRMMDRIRGG